MESVNSSSSELLSSSSNHSETPELLLDLEDVQENDVPVYQDINNDHDEDYCSIISKEATVSVKFVTTTGQIFTKAFKPTDTISDIKIQLAELFSMNVNQLDLEKEESHLADHIQLATLGVEALSSVELLVKTKEPFVLNPYLIYGHIPTVDIINIRRDNGVELIVEIEYQNKEKDWLGGYRNIITKKEYHHASTQTLRKEETFKLSKCLQINAGKDQCTNTPVTKEVQTCSLPGIEDRIVTPRSYVPVQGVVEELLDDNINMRFSEEENSPEKRSRNSFSQFKCLYNKIVYQHQYENQKLRGLNEAERRLRSMEIFDCTRKLLMQIDNEKRKLHNKLSQKNNEDLLLKAATPKIFTCRTGERVQMDMMETQRAQRLKILYDKYASEENAEEKMKTVAELRNYFANRNDFEFKDDITRLLKTELNLLTKGLMPTSSSRWRVKQFIFHYAKQLMYHEDLSVAPVSRCLHEKNVAIYRDMLNKLQDDEIKLFQCFTSICFVMQIPDMYYLVSEIWTDSSIISDCKDLSILRMTRWHKYQEWSPCNCILLTKYEVKDHLKCDIKIDYDRCFISKVKNKHLRAKIHFCDTLGTKIDLS